MRFNQIRNSKNGKPLCILSKLHDAVYCIVILISSAKLYSYAVTISFSLELESDLGKFLELE